MTYHKHHFINFLAVLLMVSLLAFSAGCQKQQADQKQQGKKKITIGTAEVGGGALYSVGSAIAKTVTDKVPGLEMMPEATGASVENLKLIQSQKAEFGFSASDIAYYAKNGAAPFNEKLDKVRTVFLCWPVPNKLVTLESSGIKSFSDLKGKVVALGAPGSGTLIWSKNIIKALGLEGQIKGQALGWDEVIDTISDGKIDAFFWAGADPMAKINELSKTKKPYFVPMTEDEVKKVTTAFPEYSPYTMKAGKTYAFQTADVLMTTSSHQIYAGSWVSDDIVYQVTKAVFENLGDIGNAHPQGKSISIDKALSEVVIPLHPGAKRYFEEVKAKGIEKIK